MFTPYYLLIKRERNYSVLAFTQIVYEVNTMVSWKRWDGHRGENSPIHGNGGMAIEERTVRSPNKIMN